MVEKLGRQSWIGRQWIGLIEKGGVGWCVDKYGTYFMNWTTGKLEKPNFGKVSFGIRVEAFESKAYQRSKITRKFNYYLEPLG